MEELVAIAEPVASAGGMVMSHIRNEDDDQIEESLRELISQGEGSGCAVHVSHIKVVYGRGAGRAEEILELMQKARERGVTVTADLYPYNASYTGIGIVFPDWSLAPNDYATVVAERRIELADYLRRRVNARNGPEATLLATAPWRGKTLAQAAREAGKPFEDLLIDDIGPGGASGAYFVMDPELQARLLKDPHVMVSTDGSPTMFHPRGYGAFARIIREFVIERRLLSIEEAVHKMSGLTASAMDLDMQHRGILAPGCAADILIFSPDNVRDRATYEEPHKLAAGMDWVIVNGIVEREEGIFTGRYGGLVLRRR
jgi:N-acyl-D-amino-acid deacylase